MLKSNRKEVSSRIQNYIIECLEAQFGENSIKTNLANSLIWYFDGCAYKNKMGIYMYSHTLAYFLTMYALVFDAET